MKYTHRVRYKRSWEEAWEISGIMPFMAATQLAKMMLQRYKIVDIIQDDNS